ncbi:MAG: C4-dicarboxylate ABC transporter substrate-binding protein, partial [Treponema sp.]|nr:C4-dicarboxylate ABC transporter substrate-binding protein [Treponema sp.]
MKQHLLFTVFALCGLASCTKQQEEPSVTLVMAEVNPPETIAGKMDYAFKEKAESLSGGTIKIDLQCSGILGDVGAVTDMMLKPHSSIHIHRMSAVNMASYGCTKTGLLSVPYTFSNKEQFWRFVK